MQVQLSFIFEGETDLVSRMEQIIQAAGFGAEQTVSPPPPAKTRAAKAAKASDKLASVPVDDVAGSADSTNGAGEQEDDDLGLTSPSMSPGEALDAALAIVRECYSSGHVAEVKALQKEWNVAKFYDVPVESGHLFYSRVMQLAQGVGVRQ